MEQKAKEKSNQTFLNLEEEKQRVANLSTSLLALKESLHEVDPESEAISSLEHLETELEQMKGTLAEKSIGLSKTTESAKDDYLKATNDYIELYESYQTVYTKYQVVNDTINSYSANTARLLQEIEKVESSILKHEDLTNKRRLQLEEIFRNKVENTDTDSLLSYYASLVQFEFILNERVQQEGNEKADLLKDDIMQALLKNAVDLSETELEGWDTVGDSIPETEKVVDDLNTSFAAILTGFEETIEMQHTSLVTELGAIEEQANVLLAQIREPQVMIAAGEPVQTSDEAEVLSGQHNISSELLSLSSLVDTLAEQQNGLVTQANSLHAKANDLQTTTTDFSDKWGTNLDSMSAFKDDIQDFLGNTYVDGQVNGYAFNHLVNPLQVNGETALAGEFKKVPPIILYLILLVSSLLIGYFTHRLKGGAIGQQVGMIALLSVLVGLIISLYSVNMYVLSDNRAIQWTVFTVLLLLASAAIIRAALDFRPTTGWVASIVIMCLYILPLLVLGVPDIKIPDLLTAVYNSIKYEVETYFAVGTVVTVLIALAMMIVSYVLSKRKEINLLPRGRAMKAKFILLLLSLCVVGGSAGAIASAEGPKDIKEFEPLNYQELEFKGNTDYLHDKQKVEMKNTLPEKQFDIDFDGSKQLPDHSDTLFLFEEAERGKKSTVTVMASEMGLFKADAKDSGTNFIGASSVNDEPTPGTPIGRTVIYMGLIIAGLLVLFGFLLPRFIHQPVPQKRK